MNIIQKKFKDRALNKGGILLFKKSDALEIVEACITEKYKILGIDAFNDLGYAIQPRMEDSIDFTSIFSKQPENIYEAALNFLKQRDESLLFEIVISSN